MNDRQARQDGAKTYAEAWAQLDRRLSAPERELGKHAQTFRTDLFPLGDMSWLAKHLCVDVQGWERLETVQDAPYFGVFVNRGERKKVTFSEGDLTVEVFPNDEMFALGLKETLEFYTRMAREDSERLARSLERMTARRAGAE